MDTQTAAQIVRLLDSFGSSAANMDPMMMRTMTEIAGEFPVTLVERVVTKFIMGKIDGQSHEFPPKPPLFAKALRMEPYAPQEQKAKRDEIKRQMDILALPKPNDDWQQPTPDEKARVAEKLAEFRAQTQANREAERKQAVKEPMTPEEAAYWSAIMDMPDRRELKPEEHRFRAKMAKEIEAVSDSQEAAA